MSSAGLTSIPVSSSYPMVHAATAGSPMLLARNVDHEWCGGVPAAHPNVEPCRDGVSPGSGARSECTRMPQREVAGAVLIDSTSMTCSKSGTVREALHLA